MKRFLLFTGYDYYPAGGPLDFHSAHATRDEAKRAFETGGEYGGVLNDWGMVAEWDGERFVNVEENTEWVKSGQAERRWEAA